jgi:hypothetical protein
MKHNLVSKHTQCVIRYQFPRDEKCNDPHRESTNYDLNS